jgi:hypothetical protein
MCTAQKNNKRLKALYEQSLHIKSAIPHPLIMGVIRGNGLHSSMDHCSTLVYRCGDRKKKHCELGDDIDAI